LVLIIAIAVFFATILGVFTLSLWMENRRESLGFRIKETVSPQSERAKPIAMRIGKRLSDGWKKSWRRTRRPEDLASMVTLEERTGLQLLLSRAGYRSAHAHKVFWFSRFGVPVFLGILAYSYGKGTGMRDQSILLLVLSGLIVGALLPGIILRSKIRKRQEEITDVLPDALDLLMVCVEAGLGVNAAFVKITEEFQLASPVVSEEFDIVNREMVAGKPRQDALRALSDRTGVEEVKSFVAMLIQTEKLGTSLARSLRIHSDSLRTRRRQRAEEAAAKTTIKLVFPLVLLLFPALFIVILGPGAIQIYRVLFQIKSAGP
jgi:tight adherence protein C